jgi:hypothetical protein
MGDGEQVWHLLRGEELVAELVVNGGDFPWLNARVRAASGLEEVRPLFEEELRLLEHIDNDVGAWEAAYESIRGTVHLRFPEGHPLPEFLLHIRGEDAWWRWSDEPFTQTEEES